jgi:hypothetical protein
VKSYGKVGFSQDSVLYFQLEKKQYITAVSRKEGRFTIYSDLADVST